MVLKTRPRVEALPERPRATTLLPQPLGAPARAIAVLAELRAADRTLGMRMPVSPVSPRRIVLTNWSARLDADWKHLDARFHNLGAAYVREVTRNADADQYEVYTATAPLLSGVAELKCSQIVDWRQALRIHAEAELALFDAEMAVAL